MVWLVFHETFPRKVIVLSTTSVWGSVYACSSELLNFFSHCILDTLEITISYAVEWLLYLYYLHFLYIVHVATFCQNEIVNNSAAFRVFQWKISLLFVGMRQMSGGGHKRTIIIKPSDFEKKRWLDHLVSTTFHSPDTKFQWCHFHWAR